MFDPIELFNPQDVQCLPSYGATNDLPHIQHILQSQPPLVSINEINALRQLIAKASKGDYFLIQTGDCAERFYESDSNTTYAKLDFIQQLAAWFHKKTGKPVIPVGRIAGQYAKPRSSLYEIYQNKRIYSYFGDMINQAQESRRNPNPWRMLLGYNCSASVYRAVNQWNQDLAPEQKIYTSHEALLLYYEQALTRLNNQTGLVYNHSTHFPWLGKRTLCSIQHVNYLKTIANPIAIKIGPDTSIKTLIAIIHELDPDYCPGRITLIPRLGAKQVKRLLPPLIDAVKRTQRTVLWSCDPMHGNTETSNSGIKIRTLKNIVDEIKHSFLIHKMMSSQLNAIHLEATHQDVMECVEEEASFNREKHKSLVDPRLNEEQTMRVIALVAKHYVDY